MTQEQHDTNQPNILRVGLVDDHAVVRDGYKRYIGLETDLQVCMEAGNAEEAYQQLAHVQPDVLVMDLSMPGRGGLEGIRRILARYPQQAILVFTMHQQADRALQCMRAGARGYITKSQTPDVLVQAIRKVAQGQTVVDTSMQADIERWLQSENAPPHHALTPREFDVFLMLADGINIEEIGNRLQLGTKTVANYQTLIRQKLDIHNAVDLYRYAVRHGLL